MKFIPAFLLCLFFLPVWGCLTVESKEYCVKLRTDHSGEATIRFLNIMSESDDTLDISKEDFAQLIDFYLQGSQLEKDNPGFRNVKKRLYEQDGMLNGELTFTFDSLSTLRIFRFDKDSPYMYFVGSPLSSEQFIESNGTYGREWMPVVFWQRDSRELYVKTKVMSEVAHHRSLLKNYKEWLSTKETPQQKNPGQGSLRPSSSRRRQG